MGNQNPVIFPFPAVQYIPLAITDVCEGPIPGTGPAGKTPKLIAGPGLASWQSIVSREYGIAVPREFPPLTFPVLAIHLKISGAKYRGFFVTMLGAERYGYYQLFTVPSERFYKPKLFFQAFDPVTTEKLAEFSLFMPEMKTCPIKTNNSLRPAGLTGLYQTPIQNQRL